jgi:error-prone DNA polymerase
MEPTSRPYVPAGDGESPIDRAARIRADAVPYAELHAHSTFSFLDGASQPERLVETRPISVCTVWR